MGLDKVEKLSEDFSPKLKEYVNKIIQRLGHVTYDIRINKFNTGGSNFLSTLYEVDIKDTTDEAKETNLFIKEIIPLNKIKIVDVEQLFSRELFVYKEFSKLCTELQDETNVPVEDRIKTVKCHEESVTQFIILENLTRHGFKICPRMDIVTLKFSELSIQELARFHGMSFVIQNKMPQYFEKYIMTMKNPYKFDDDARSLFDKVCLTAANQLDGELKTKLLEFSKVFNQTYTYFITHYTPYKCVMTHGDYKGSNILKKDIDGETSEVVMIDFQTVHYSSPVDDFFFFIFSGTDREFRKNHLDYLKNLYFETMTRFLKYFDIDIETVYSRSDYENDYKERLLYGLAMGLFTNAFVLISEHESFDASNKTLSDFPVNSDRRFVDRVRDMIQDFIDWGYL